MPHAKLLNLVERSAIAASYKAVRAQTLRLIEPLSPEDMVVQAAECASPTKWHLAHTTWFFETFILEPQEPGFRPYDESFRVLYNSYYHGVGAQHPLAKRGFLTRPGVGEILAYRDTVDDRMLALLGACDNASVKVLEPLVILGLQHEQQHQELLLTDIKLLLGSTPTAPAYIADADATEPGSAGSLGWIGYDPGVVEIGHAPDDPGFAYDNEGPLHREFLEPFRLADRLATNLEFLDFINDGGYERPELWLDAGWSAVNAGAWTHPLHWRRAPDGSWSEFTLTGLRGLAPETPVCHLSFFEADAFARWSEARLPTEAEWEHGATAAPAAPVGLQIASANFVESGRYHPCAAPAPAEAPRQFFGDVWEWTRSAHEPYPGYRPPDGAIGEYNGKFMCGSFVLRGGSCATPASHIRPTYRNFFSPESRWQFSGVRLARSGL